MIYLKLYYEFFKIGLFSIGGGLTTLPFLGELGIKLNWFTQSELTSMLAISESTPGPIGINMATYVGYKVGGILGSLCATIGEVSPSLIIIILIAKVLEDYKNNKYVSYALNGLRPITIGLITSAFIKILISVLINENTLNLINYKALGIFVVIALLTREIKIHPIFFIAISAIAGIVLSL